MKKCSTTTDSRRVPSPASIRRAVASSTAIETGQSVAALEAKLLRGFGNSKFRHLKLAR